jgi:predicted nucleic acid-binding protein
MGLVLDSSVVIAAERRGENVAQMLKQIVALAGDQRSALSAIGLVELAHGIYRAQSSQVRIRREAFVKELISALEVFPFTRETGLLAGKLDGEQQSRGIIIPFADLLIGATALEIGYSILTVNVRHFRSIPGLTVIQF